MIPTYVINLARSKERRRSIGIQLKRADIPYTLVEAYDAIRDNSAYSHSLDPGLSRGHIGCVMSHIKTWKMIQSQVADYALIMEDDVIISKDLRQIIESAESYLRDDSIYQVCMQIQGPVHCSSEIRLSKGYEIWKCWEMGGARGTQAYIISKKLAGFMAERLYPVRCNIDMWLDYRQQSFFKDMYIFFPFPVVHGEFLSDLNEEKIRQRNLKEKIKLLVYQYRIWPFYELFLRVRRARVERRQQKYLRIYGQPVSKTFKL